MLGIDAVSTLPLDTLPDSAAAAVTIRRRSMHALSNIVRQSTAVNVEIVMVDSTDHVTGKASLTLTITLGKNGGVQTSITPTVTDRGNGIYNIALTTSHTDTLGEGMLYVTGTGADPQWLKFKVVAGEVGALPHPHLEYPQRLADGGDGIRFTLVDFDGKRVTGQAASITAKISVFGGTPATAAGTFTEINATDHPGEYYYVMHASEVPSGGGDGVISLYMTSATSAFRPCTVGATFHTDLSITFNGNLTGTQSGPSTITLNETTAAQRRIYMTLIDSETGLRDTGVIAGNFTNIKISKAGGAAVATAGTLVEIDAVDAPGEYYYECTAGEVDTEGVITIYFEPSDGTPFTLSAQVADSSAPTAGAVADAVWDEARAGHVTAGTFGEYVLADTIKVSGDTTAADNLELQYDGTGLTGATFPARQDSYEVRRATAQAGAAGTITLDASASATNDFYNRRTIVLVGGTGAGQARLILDYVGSTKVATVTPAWNTAPDATSVFVILPTAGTHLQTSDDSSGQPAIINGSVGGNLPANVTLWRSQDLNDLIAGNNTGLPSANVINAGTAAAGAATTITLGTSSYGLIATSTVDDFYNGSRIWIASGTGAGQERIITDYVGATKVATVDTAWVTNPNATSKYVILAGGRQTTAALGTVSADVVSISGDSVAADNLELQFDGTGLTGGTFPATQTQATNIQADTDDIQTRLPAALTAGGNMKADVIAVSGDTAAADNLELQFDGTGLTGATFPQRQDSTEIRRNTATAGGASTITLDAGASATTNFYKNAVVLIISGTGAGQNRSITSYDGGTKVATVDSAWATNPDATSVFVLLASAAAGATGGTVDANIVSISGDSVAADNLEAMYDGTGLTGDNFPAKQSQVDTVEASVARIQGLLHENSRVDKQVYDSSNNLISARLRVFSSKAAADASTAWNGSTPADNAEGEIQRYTITAAYSGALLNSYKLVRDL